GEQVKSRKAKVEDWGEQQTLNVQHPTPNSEKPDGKLHCRKREQVWKHERLHTGAGWFHSLDSEGPGGRAAAGTGRCARRVARDLTTICRGAVGNGSRSRTDRDYVVARSEARCAEGASAQRSESLAHR